VRGRTAKADEAELQEEASQFTEEVSFFRV
jgi:hypothetical protein